MEVFWSNDVSLSDVDKSDKEKKRLQTNAKKPTPVAKEKASNPLREKMKSAVRKRNEQIQRETPDAVTSNEGDVAQKQMTLKDLCPEDKQRVANLIKELARLGEEKENAMSQLAQQKTVYEEQTKALAREKEKMKMDREAVELQLKECQLLLDKYQKFLTEQQEKRSVANGNDVEKDLKKPELHVKENQTEIPKAINQIQCNNLSYGLLPETRKPVSVAVVGIQPPSIQNNVSYFSDAHSTSLATSNPVLPKDVQSDNYLHEKFSFQRPSAVISSDSGRTSLSKDQSREPNNIKQPFFSDSPNRTKMPMSTGPLNRPNLSSTRCSEYRADDGLPMEMQYGSCKTTQPIVRNAPRVLERQVTSSSTADEEFYRKTDLRNAAAFVVNQKMSGFDDRMALANSTEYNGVKSTWLPLRNSSQNNRQIEDETVEPFPLSRDSEDCVRLNERSAFEMSFNSIPISEESERQGNSGSLNVDHIDHKEELLAQRKALLEEQRRLNEALLIQEAFFNKQEHELKLLQESQHRSRVNMERQVPSSDIREIKRNEEFHFTSRYDSNSRHSQKPAQLVGADLSVSWDQRSPRLVSAATTPVKLLHPRTLSTAADPQRDRAKIRPSITSRSAEESKTSWPILKKASKLPTEIQENIDGKKSRILQTKQTQPNQRHSKGSTDSHRVVANSSLVSRSSQMHDDDNDSDSSMEDSKIIEDLFFVK